MKTWFITGASSGFGAAVAQKALAKGDAVVATGRKPDAVRQRLGEHANLLILPLDVTDEAAAVAAADAAIARFGRIDILMNNAGYGLIGAVEEASADEVERLYRTNVFGLLAVLRAVLPHMRRARSGHVLNVASMGGYRAAMGLGLYCSTKFAIEGLTEALRMELKPLGIKVTAIAPGFFRTNFFDPASVEPSAARLEDYEPTAGKVRGIAEGFHGTQPGDPERLADVVVGFVDRPEPSGRLPLGSDAIAALEATQAARAALLDEWRSAAASTDYAAPAAR